MDRVEGKVAIITGGGSGIGRAGALALAREGARIVATDLNVSAAEETASAIRGAGGEAIALVHDVGEESQWAAVMDAAQKAFGRLDVLVNNAGVSGKGPLADTAPEDWRALMRVNLDGVYLGTRAAIAAMQPQGTEREQFGSIVMISSILGIVGGPRSAPYSASKGAVRLFAKAAAMECAAAGDNIRVNSVHPGLIDTPIWPAGTDVHARAKPIVPMARAGEAEEIAKGVLFLASDASSYMTGAELVIDGGMTGGAVRRWS
jgi:NAD(P)-dependent dehydrogenase (short-subunit alcohol dehydrogenase family)